MTGQKLQRIDVVFGLEKPVLTFQKTGELQLLRAHFVGELLGRKGHRVCEYQIHNIQNIFC